MSHVRLNKINLDKSSFQILCINHNFMLTVVLMVKV